MDLPPELALIAGTGTEDWNPETSRPVGYDTPYGRIEGDLATLHGHRFLLFRRHGKNHALPPHKVNYRGLVWACRMAGVRRVVATAAVGAIRDDLAPGRILVLDDLIDLTEGRPSTFFDHAPRLRHVDMTRPYCPELQRRFQGVLAAAGEEVEEGIVYAATRGPRFETAAEIRALGLLGAHVVGMTQAPEVALAREAGLCYLGVAMVVNPAASRNRPPISEEAIEAVLKRQGERFRQHFVRFLDALEDLQDPCPICPESALPAPLPTESRPEGENTRPHA